MYILKCFINLFQRGGRSLASVCWSRFRRNVASDEHSEPIASSERNATSSYRSIDLESSSGLTATYTTFWQSQQATNLCLLHIAIYLLLAVLGYSFLFEHWRITDSIYFAVVVFTTVGYGDIAPSNDASRMYTVCLAFYGIVILGIFLGMIAEHLIDQQEETIKQRQRKARSQMMEQMSEREVPLQRKNRVFMAELLAICIAEGPILVILLVFVIPVAYLEGWDAVESFYWMFITGSTMGLGDLRPTHVVTRCICIVYIPIACAVTGEFLGRVAGHIIDSHNDENEHRFLKRAMTLRDLRKMDTDEDNKVSKHEFLIHVLVTFQKVEQEDIDEIMEVFKRLDRNNSGCINKEDLMMESRFQSHATDDTEVAGSNAY